MSILMLQVASVEAVRLDHDYVGPEHGLLAVLRGDPEEAARQALEEAGLTATMVEEMLSKMQENRPRSALSSGRRAPNPAWYGVAGRAEGFAACLGTGEPRPVDLVLAMLWDTNAWLFAEKQGVSREAVAAALSRRGAQLPSAPPPPLDDREFTQKVDFPRARLDAVVALLSERHPPGSGPSFGFNHNGKRSAWAVAEDGIDLQGIVDEVVAKG
ncbi:MAG TPA: Clp protease N-terminal domain-containing protein [Acidimicrobiales bacterium]|nr:Clp protease N-terminal domain-containing protein [Acidimicrobiales bacterium]